MSEQIVTQVVCSECGGTNIVRDAIVGELVCGDCGLVIQDNILNRGAEWKAFTPMHACINVHTHTNANSTSTYKARAELVFSED